MSNNPATLSGRIRAASSANQPPMLEPTVFADPVVNPSITANASSSQREIVPARKSPLERP